MVVVGVLLRSLAPLALSGLPATHDGEGHVARIANYAVAVRQGHIPPRIAPTFWDGYGYPIFNFHYPLLSILGTPLVLVGVHPELALKFWVVVGWLALWLGTYLFVLKITTHRTAAMLGVLVAALNPYFYSLVYVRGSYGELFATAAAVWLVYFLEKRIQKSQEKKQLDIGVIVSGAIVLLAHNIYAVLLFPAALLYGIFRQKHKNFLTVGSEFAIAFGISSFFWIPALLEKKYVRFDEQFSQFYLDHFVNFSQLFTSKVTFGISTPGSDDTLSMGIGMAGLVTIGVAGLYFIFKKLPFSWSSVELKTKNNATGSDLPVVVAAALSLASIFILLPMSLFLWKTIFVLPYFQFPWRFLGPLSIVLAVLAALLWTKKNRVLQTLLGLGVVANLVFFTGWYWPTYSHFAPEYYLNYYQTSTIFDEFRAKTFTVSPGKLSAGTPEVQGNGRISEVKWRGTYRSYRVQAAEQVTVVEPTMYFPGWKVWANGTAAAMITPENDSERSQQYKGQVAYVLPAGDWQIYSKMTQQTPARIIGNTLTVASLLVIGWLGGQRLRSYAKFRRVKK